MRVAVVLLCCVAVNAGLQKTPFNRFSLMPQDNSQKEFEASAAQSLLEVSSMSSRTSMDYCYSVGDTHTLTFYPKTRFNVMGDNEWIVAEGPTGPTTAKWVVQAQQRAWRYCGKRYPYITVNKDIALRCGNFYALVASSPEVAECYIPNNHVFNHHLFVKGSNKHTKREYDGSDYFKDPDFGQGKSIVFDDGTGQEGRLIVTRNQCAPNSCTCSKYYRQNYCRYYGARVIYNFQCQGTDTQIILNHSSNGGIYIDMYVRVPYRDVNSNIRVDSSWGSGTLVGGYCAGWDMATKNNLYNTWNQCKYVRPQGFYQNNCNKQFITTASNSLFGAFEHWSRGKFASRWSTTQAMASAADVEKEAFDYTKYNNAKSSCIAMAAKVDTQTAFKEKPTNPKEMNIYAQVLDCTEDVFYEVPWSEEDMKKNICEIQAFKVRQERRDIFCAAKNLEKKGKELDPKTSLAPALADCKTPKDVETCETFTGQVTNMVEEVDSSTKGVLYWSTPLCDSLIPDETDLAQTDCDSWDFETTISEMSKGFGNSNEHLLASGLRGVNENGQDISLDQAEIDDPVIFLGPPSFTDPTPVVFRVSKLSKDRFKVFATTPSCNLHAHGGEAVGYLAMDAAFDYGKDIKIIKATVGYDWVTVPFGRDFGSKVRIFATIQTTNNNGCYDCSKSTGLNGYLVVRAYLTSNSEMRIRLQTDRVSSYTSIKPETVAILVVGGEGEGSISGQHYETSLFITGTTSAGTNQPPSTFQTVPTSGFGSTPVSLVQIASFQQADSVGLRTHSAESRYTKVVLDKDNCHRSYTRSHPSETLHVLSVSPTGVW